MPVISPETAANASNSCYTCIGGPTAEMSSYLRLVFNPTGLQSYAVDVHVGQSYTVAFYDACTQKYITATGTVSGLSTDAIALYTVTVIDADGNLCLCSKRPNLSGYIGTETYHIPIANIAKIEAYSEKEPKPEPTPTERSETFVSILGISSTVIHAVIVRLKIFNDDVQHSCTEVDMEVGRTYHVTYVKSGESTVYEITGRLIQIKELPQFGDESPECGYVRPDGNTEQIGMDGNIYDARYFHSLPKYNPDGDRIQFVFDTSKDFQQLHDTVMLKDIRFVKDLSHMNVPPCPPTINPPPPPPPPFCPPPQPPCPPHWPGWEGPGHPGFHPGCPPFNPPPPRPCPPWGDQPPYNPGPGDMPPGWTPGDDPVDPGFNHPLEPGIWTPTSPMPGGQQYTTDSTGYAPPTPYPEQTTAQPPQSPQQGFKVDSDFYK